MFLSDLLLIYINYCYNVYIKYKSREGYNMDIKEKHHEKIQGNGFRLTKNRIAIIEILEDGKLTFKELQDKLAARNLKNVASIYNNLDFLLSENIIIELRLGNKTYYDLAHYNKNNETHHLYIFNKDKNETKEIVNKELIDLIKNHKAFSKYKIQNIKLIIEAKEK